MTAPETMLTIRTDVAAAPPQPRLAWSGPYLFASAAGRRPYYVYTPARYQVGTSVPLVVMLHGCSQTPRGVAVATQWNDLAEEHNFIVVYPGQTLACSRRHHRIERCVNRSACRLPGWCVLGEPARSVLARRQR